MRVWLSSYGLRWNVEPMVGLAVWVQALGAQCDMAAAVVGGCDALVATGVMPTGGWL